MSRVESKSDSLGCEARHLLETSCTLCDEFRGTRRFLTAVFGFEFCRTILETSAAAVVPSLGQVVEGHLLVVPKRHTTSWASLAEDEFISVEEMVGLAEGLVAEKFGQYVVFEHGMNPKCPVGGCGVIHAHVHIVPGKISLQRAVAALGCGPIENYRGIRRWQDDEYVLLKYREGTFAGPVKAMPSQFLRQIVSQEVGREVRWDWREYVGRIEVIRWAGAYRGLLGSRPKEHQDAYTNQFLALADQIATKGSCSIRKVGAVVVLKGESLVMGWNGTPEGLPSCEDAGHLWRDGHCVRALHAEAMCVARASREGIELRGGDLFVTAYPCYACFKLVAECGIRRIFCRPYTVDLMVEQTARAVGVEIFSVDGGPPRQAFQDGIIAQWEKVAPAA